MEDTRTGEQGKGFAVLASEMRKLAGQSTQTTESSAIKPNP
jgi:methyl-accepting chemotaxis protein